MELILIFEGSRLNINTYIYQNNQYINIESMYQNQVK